MRTRYLVIINLANGRSALHAASAVQVARSTVYRIAGRFRETGEAGLIDRREENGERKLDEQYLQTLYDAVASSPEQHGWPRPTWTREMLVLTPGKNQKRYLAGALDARTGEVLWVEGERKTSLLFLHLLWKLTRHYRKAKVIHVVLDNYSIHSTQQVAISLETEPGQRLRLHFLPPDCPDHNRIERTWEDLHANVTRNHTCREMPRLMHRVRGYLLRRNHRCRNTTAA